MFSASSCISSITIPAFSAPCSDAAQSRPHTEPTVVRICTISVLLESVVVESLVVRLCATSATGYACDLGQMT